MRKLAYFFETIYSGRRPSYIIHISPQAGPQFLTACVHFFVTSKVARIVDEHGTAVILKNNVPRYLIIDFAMAENSNDARDEDVLDISQKIMSKNKAAYEVLAQ